MRFAITITVVMWAISAGGGLAAPQDMKTPPTGDERSAVRSGIPVLTFDDAIRKGITQSPLIQASKHGVEETEAVTKQIESINYPQVRGVLTQTSGNTRVLSNLGISGSLPKATNALTNLGGRADLLITDFGRTAHRILANKAVTAAAEKDVMTNKAVVILNVQHAYLNCLKQQRLVQIIEATVRQRQLIRDQAETFYKNQLRAKLDLDLASVELAKADVALLRATNELKMAVAALNYAMGGWDQGEYQLDDTPLPATNPLPDEPADPSMEPLFRQGLDKRPELLASQDRVQASEEALKAARALNWGTISGIATTGITYYNKPPFAGVAGSEGKSDADGQNIRWYGAGLVSSTPLFTGFRIEGAIEEAEGRQAETRATTRSIANDIVLQIAQAYFTRRTAAQQIDVAAARLDHAREMLGLARERYKRGLGSILDVTVATVEVLNADTTLAETQYDYRASEVALAYALGSDYSRY